jgi:hypothetical protein
VLLCRPSANELAFHVFGRALHPELFDILASQRLEREDYTLNLWITRTGHVTSFDNGKLCVTEVLAARDDPLPENGRLLSYRIRQEHQGRIEPVAGVHYQASCQREVLPPELYVEFHDELMADGARRGFLFNFRPNHRLTVAPLGYMNPEARPNSLLIHSFHTFPDEYTVIKAQTLIERR